MPTAADRIITPAEVKAWFGTSPQGRLSPGQYEAATYLTEKMIWPCDAPKTNDEVRQVEPDDNPYWDFDAATDAAKLLQTSLPAMLIHWEGLQWAPETQSGHPAISKLKEALAEALPYIEWPFGRYERRPRTGQKAPKPWHGPGLLIARSVIKVLVESGHSNPSLERNSLMPRSFSGRSSGCNLHLKPWLPRPYRHTCAAGTRNTGCDRARSCA